MTEAHEIAIELALLEYRLHPSPTTYHALWDAITSATEPTR